MGNGQARILSAVVDSVSLKRNIRLCIWESEDGKVRKFYFTTNIRMKAKVSIEYYITRFQIEFCYRDGKQFTELTDCQSRDLNKLHFHFNASLTSVNPAKVKALEKGNVLSMSSVKVLCNDIFLMQRFMAVLGIKPNEEINRRLWEEGIRFAAIAA